MRKTIIGIALLALAVAGLVRAQILGEVTLNAPTGQVTVRSIEQDGVLFVAADTMISAFGGQLVPDPQGYRVTIENQQAVFGADNRFAVVRDELIEMPKPPLIVEGTAFVPLEFFQALAKAVIDSDLAWDAKTRLLLLRSIPREALSAQVSVVDLQGLSKIVIQLSGRTEYTISRRGAVYVIHTKNRLQSSVTERTYEDPLVAHVAVQGQEVTIQLRSADLTGSAYPLDDPFRIVFDVRAGGSGTATGASTATPETREARATGVRTIVLDPGHGGKETGAIGAGGLLEKDATLQICRKAAAELQKRLGMRVFLTRNGDEQVPLDQRSALANQHKADLFLSVHLNASLVRGAKGSETYFLSLEASDDQARKAAEAENAVSASSGPSAGSSDLRMILWDLAQQEYLKESSRFAELIQEEMNSASGVGNRGVKQAPFRVLVGATMPAALVELAFISNPDEEAKFSDDQYQALLVKALVDAVARFKVEYEAKSVSLLGSEP